MISLSKLLKKINRAAHREIIDPLLLKFFMPSENAICSTYNTRPVFAQSIISNYFQSMLLFGITSRERMYWYRKDNLYWQILHKRGIITTETAKIPRRLKSYLNKNVFEFRYDVDFEGVIRACQREKETWINEPLIEAYRVLNEQGYVHTVEAYQENKLVGGMWGIMVGRTFSIMSMFHEVDNVGAVALGTLVKRLEEGKYGMIDCGANNDNFSRYGATTVSREQFMKYVIDYLN